MNAETNREVYVKYKKFSIEELENRSNYSLPTNFTMANQHKYSIGYSTNREGSTSNDEIFQTEVDEEDNMSNSAYYSVKGDSQQN